VSSETGFDYLEFHINGVLQSGRISGNEDWQQKSYTLPGGTHTLRWRYTKDASITTGTDAGWVDQVVWTPSASAYAAWQALHFTPAEIANPLISGPDADPDKDGQKNLIEFAFGLNPKSGSSLSPPAPQMVGGNYVISFTEPAGMNGITYGAEWSTTLAPGNWTPVPDTGVGGVHTFRVPVVGKPSLFMRHIVTTP